MIGAAPPSRREATMLTAVQRAEILGLAAQSDLGPGTVTDEDIWYGFLSSLFGAGKTLKDLRLTRSQQPEIMACLRQAPSVPPRTFSKRGERPIRSSTTPGLDSNAP
jgi:hypothetical protein